MFYTQPSRENKAAGTPASERFSSVRASSALSNKEMGLGVEADKNCHLLTKSGLLFGVPRHLAVFPGT